MVADRGPWFAAPAIHRGDRPLLRTHHLGELRGRELLREARRVPEPLEELQVAGLAALGVVARGVEALRRVLETGDVPTVWTVGYVRWLHKGGSELDWLNFRGITLASVVGKTFERVLLARLSLPPAPLRSDQNFHHISMPTPVQKIADLEILSAT